ncbi:MAG: DUF2752 domain-containing protein [Clostridiales bacterium]|nr:DUF2752 domain-containing protein [Clostridiales bacterium]
MQKSGTVRFFIIVGGLLLTGFLYLIFIRINGKGFSCPMFEFTGLKCITCGITRMFVELSKGHIKEAFLANRYVFLTLPLILWEIVYVLWQFCHGKKLSRINVTILWLLLSCGLLFMIIRNIVMW